jgi:hypothetical protein
LGGENEVIILCHRRIFNAQFKILLLRIKTLSEKNAISFANMKHYHGHSITQLTSVSTFAFILPIIVTIIFVESIGPSLVLAITEVSRDPKV